MKEFESKCQTRPSPLKITTSAQFQPGGHVTIAAVTPQTKLVSSNCWALQADPLLY